VIAEPAASGPLFQLSGWAAAVGAALLLSLAALGLAIAAFVSREDGSVRVRAPLAEGFGFREFAPGGPGLVPRFGFPDGQRPHILPAPRYGA
jgi:hypothetical protein